MKTIRILFCVLTILFFFLLGVSIADKEYLSNSVVGICILGDDQEIRTLIDKSSCTDAAALICEIEDSGLSLELRLEKRYLNDDIAVMGCFPDAVYDTIIIDAHGDGKTVYLKQIDPVCHRFDKTELPIAAFVQNYYIAFLDLLGKAEKLTMDYLGGF